MSTISINNSLNSQTSPVKQANPHKETQSKQISVHYFGRKYTFTVKDGSFEYKIRRGDVLSKVHYAAKKAARKTGITRLNDCDVNEAAKANGIENPDIIYPNKTINFNFSDNSDKNLTEKKYTVKNEEKPKIIEEVSALEKRKKLIRELPRINIPELNNNETMRMAEDQKNSHEILKNGIPARKMSSVILGRFEFYKGMQKIANANVAEKAEKQALENKYHTVVDKHGFKRMSSKFGYRIHPIKRRKKFHSGVDIAAEAGTPVYTPLDGKVVSVRKSRKGYGNRIEIKHSDGTRTFYAHLQGCDVKKGQQVKAGEQIATVGSTGFSTGPHLHFEVIVKNKGKVDPETYLDKWLSSYKNKETVLREPVKQNSLLSSLHNRLLEITETTNKIKSKMSFGSYMQQVCQLHGVKDEKELDQKAINFAKKVNPKIPEKDLINYFTLVKQECKKVNLDPMLEWCLIAKESSFKRLADSKASAKGLAQIWPPTGERIHKAFYGEKASKTSYDLTDPETNIKYSVKYLTESFDTELKACDLRKRGIIALAGYNGNPEKYLKPSDLQNKNVWETRHYVCCVYNAYEALKADDIDKAAKYGKGNHVESEEVNDFVKDVAANKVKIYPFLDPIDLNP